MSSSPSDEPLRAIAHGYDQALEAVLKDDLERAQALLSGCEQHFTGLATSAAESARDDALQAHGRLLDALRQQKDATLRELRAVREGRSVLAGYGGRAEATGRRVVTDV